MDKQEKKEVVVSRFEGVDLKGTQTFLSRASFKKRIQRAQKK